MKILVLFILLSFSITVPVFADVHKKTEVHGRDAFMDDFRKHHAAIQREFNEMFEAQKRYFAKIENDVSKAMKRGDTKTIMVEHSSADECKYKIAFASFARDEVHISVHDGILTIACEHDVKQAKKGHAARSSNFYYSTTLAPECIGAPSIEYGEKHAVINFEQKPEVKA